MFQIWILCSWAGRKCCMVCSIWNIDKIPGYIYNIAICALVKPCCRYVDGADYMESVADAMMLVTQNSLFTISADSSFDQVTLCEERVKTNLCGCQAKEEIFITDWWLSPELCLKVLTLNKIPKRSTLMESIFLCIVELRRGLNQNYTKSF